MREREKTMKMGTRTITTKKLNKSGQSTHCGVQENQNVRKGDTLIY